MDNVIEIVGDNYSLNNSIAQKINIPLIRCASHRFNLAVSQIIRKEEKVVENIQQLMLKLRILILSARLRMLTNLSQ